jgi:ABC-type antimicrobial peptide transport system permease subunit
VWLFSIIGVFVLLLACINFMNLSTARSEKRAKEVGIRKSIGSLRSQLVFQFLSESFLVVAFALILATAGSTYIACIQRPFGQKSRVSIRLSTVLAYADRLFIVYRPDFRQLSGLLSVVL